MFFITKVCSDGFSTGRESYTFVGRDRRKLVDLVYMDYKKEAEELKDCGLLKDCKLTKKEFVSAMRNNEYVVIQAPGFHIQYEPWAINLEKIK